MVDYGGIISKDDNVVKIGEDVGRRGIGSEGSEVVFEGGEAVADGDGEEEGSEGIPLTHARRRLGELGLAIWTDEGDESSRTVSPSRSQPELRTVTLPCIHVSTY
jgi:hypothetical protein